MWNQALDEFIQVLHRFEQVLLRHVSDNCSHSSSQSLSYPCWSRQYFPKTPEVSAFPCPEPARVVEKAASISVTSGDSCALQCTVSGSPELNVKWFKNGKEVVSGRRYKPSLKGNMAVLKILSAEKDDSAEYSMEVWNKVGKDQTSCSVTVSGQSYFRPGLDLL